MPSRGDFPIYADGRLTQRLECHLHTVEVRGSNPRSPTTGTPKPRAKRGFFIMIQLVLYQPEIPQNTGSIARLCAATDTPLHLIEPLGFKLTDRYLKRAGLDYWPHVKLSVWPDWQAFLQGATPGRLVFTSSGNRGIKGVDYHMFRYTAEDAIVLGTESTGLPESLLAGQESLVRIPIWGCVRSLNIANAASILLYEALRSTNALPDNSF